MLQSIVIQQQTRDNKTPTHTGERPTIEARMQNGEKKDFLTLLLLLLQIQGLLGLDTLGVAKEPQVLGLRLVQVDGKNFYTEQGILSLETGATASIQVLGVNISDGSEVRLSTAHLEEGQDCSKTNASHPLLHSAVARLKAGGILEIDG